MPGQSMEMEFEASNFEFQFIIESVQRIKIEERGGEAFEDVIEGLHHNEDEFFGDLAPGGYECGVGSLGFGDFRLEEENIVEGLGDSADGAAVENVAGSWCCLGLCVRLV